MNTHSFQVYIECLHKLTISWIVKLALTNTIKTFSSDHDTVKLKINNKMITRRIKNRQYVQSKNIYLFGPYGNGLHKKEQNSLTFEFSLLSPTNLHSLFNLCPMITSGQS